MVSAGSQKEAEGWTMRYIDAVGAYEVDLRELEDPS
jgi:hypothetical protein